MASRKICRSYPPIMSSLPVRTLRPLCALLLLVLLSACLNTTHRPSTAPAPGMHLGVPDLSQFRDKVVLLTLWATWCGKCGAQLQQLQELQRRFSDESFLVITVAVDDHPVRVRSFLEQHRLALPVFVDERGAMRRQAGVAALPATLLYNSRGGRIPLLDPESNAPVRIILGARNWLSPAFLRFIAAEVQHSTASDRA